MQRITAPLGGMSNSKDRKIPARVAIRETQTDTTSVERKEVETRSADIGGMAMKEEANMSPTAFIANTIFAEAIPMSK